jgi:all-trans-retinol 13,14-reductase
LQSNEYNIVVIGAGLGGLLSAALLAKEGFKVLVLEKNKQIGGALQSFGLDGKLFESAVHYVGSLAEGQTLHKLYTYLGIMDKLSLHKLDQACFDQIIIQDKTYSFAQGYEAYIDALSQSFPIERQGLQNFCTDMQQVCSHFPLYHLNLGDAANKKKVMLIGLAEKINQHIKDPQLQQVLGGNNLLYGGSYHSTPFFLHALIENSYIEGSWKFTEGSAQLAKLLQQIIQEHGGEVKRNQHITSIKESNGRIQYVSTSEGVTYFTKQLISNLHPSVTYAMLDSSLIKPITRRRIAITPNTLSAFMVNISLKENQIQYQNFNTYYHTSNNVWKDTELQKIVEPNSYGLYWYADKKNPGYANALSILCYMNEEDVLHGMESYRTTSFPDSRGAVYEEWKLKKINSILHTVSKLIPTLKSAILKVDACTPLSYRDYLNAPSGSMYGVKKEVDDLANTTFSTRTKIQNLFFTGQNINLHGVLGVSITSILTAAEFVGLAYLVNKIKTAP